MSKYFLRDLLFTGLMLGMVVFVSCSKSKDDPNPSINFKTYTLYNASAGSNVEAGSFRIDQLKDGNAKIAIAISQPFRQPNASFEAVINKKDTAGNELVFADLGLVNGGSGTLITNPVISSGSNLPIKYNDLVGNFGYYVKVMNGANVQAKGDIE
jgi:hypothetical protein